MCYTKTIGNPPTAEYPENYKKMSKKKGYVSDGPMITSIDEIALLSDEELSARVNRFEAERGRTRDPYPWEVEIAYFRREQQIRKKRAEAHDQWLANNPVDTNYDFDPSQEGPGEDL